MLGPPTLKFSVLILSTGGKIHPFNATCDGRKCKQILRSVPSVHYCFVFLKNYLMSCFPKCFPQDTSERYRSVPKGKRSWGQESLGNAGLNRLLAARAEPALCERGLWSASSVLSSTGTEHISRSTHITWSDGENALLPWAAGNFRSRHPRCTFTHPQDFTRLNRSEKEDAVLSQFLVLHTSPLVCLCFL